MERENVIFFPLLFNILEHLIFGYLIFYHHPLVHLHLHLHII